MKDWAGIAIGNIVAWLGAFMSLNEVNLMLSIIATLVGAIAAILCGASKVIEQRSNRRAAKFKEIYESRKMCELCVKSPKPFVNCGVPSDKCSLKK